VVLAPYTVEAYSPPGRRSLVSWKRYRAHQSIHDAVAIPFPDCAGLHAGYAQGITRSSNQPSGSAAPSDRFPTGRSCGSRSEHWSLPQAFPGRAGRGGRAGLHPGLPLRIEAFNSSTIGCGVLLGARKPSQTGKSRPSTPNSLVEGTLGQDGNPRRPEGRQRSHGWPEPTRPERKWRVGGHPYSPYCGSLEVDRNENCAFTEYGRR
jgi:hypothetical protein